MNRRIFLFLLSVSIISIIASVLVVNIVSYKSFQNEIQSDLRNQALAMRELLNEAPEKYYTSVGGYLEEVEFRTTIIAESGEVLFDNFVDWRTMENHSNRPEVADAIHRGFGSATRYSTTLGKNTFYYAVRLKENTILRLARTTNSMHSFFYESLLFIGILVGLGVVLVTVFAKILAKKIVDPINTMDTTDFSNCPYDELGPMVQRIKNQKKELRQQFHDIEVQSQTMHTIIDNVHGGLMLVDPNGLIQETNREIAEMYELTQEELQGRNILEIFREIDLFGGLKACQKGDPWECTITRHEKTFQTYMTPVRSEGVTVGVTILMLDISEKVGMEQLRREFSANVSHELKTPLTSILGYGEILKGGMAPPKDTANLASNIVEEANRLIQLIGDIITLSRLDEGSYPKESEVINLESMVKQILFRLSTQLEETEVSASIEGEENLLIRGNPRMIDTLLHNLIHNGIKYNRQGGTLLIYLKRTPDGKAEICIKDTGVGISTEDQQRIFERFYRVDSSRSKQTGGTGLGLSIAKHITRMHNGSLQVESTPGKGTTFTIIL